MTLIYCYIYYILYQILLEYQYRNKILSNEIQILIIKIKYLNL